MSGYDFYRKELFKRVSERFLRVGNTHRYVLVKPRIFECKASTGSITVTEPKQKTYHFLVSGCELWISGGKGVLFRWKESDINNVLALKTKGAVDYEIVTALMERHRTSSKESPFISGLPGNKLYLHKTFEGHKFHAKLKSRQPIKNPSRSGIEDEVLLIGKLDEDECYFLHYLGYDSPYEHVAAKEEIVFSRDKLLVSGHLKQPDAYPPKPLPPIKTNDPKTKITHIPKPITTGVLPPIKVPQPNVRAIPHPPTKWAPRLIKGKFHPPTSKE